MNLDTFLSFLMKHNATIIEVLVGFVLLFVLLLAVRSFLFAKDESLGTGAHSMGDLEASLKKILEKANQIPQIANGEADAPLLAEIGKLKSELEVKQKQIEELSVAGTGAAPAGPGLSADEKDKLEAQIKELQAKLSEYEIISEDIADLSFYKEQNARLQKELEAAKSGAPIAAGAPVPEAAPAVAVAPVPTPDPLEESMSALTAQAEVTPSLPAEVAAAAEQAAAAPPTEVAPPVENVVDNDLMAEFDAAVEKQKVAEAEADLGSMNMDKMLAEAAEIKTDVPEVSAEDILNQSLDESKLLLEANAMKKEEASTEDKKLMGDFENFVKKGDA